MTKLEWLNLMCLQDLDKTMKICEHNLLRVDLVVKRKEKLHPSKFYLDDYTWNYKKLEEVVKELELQEFVKNFLSQEFPKGKDPSYFIYETWTRKIFDTNAFESFSAIYFPKYPTPTNQQQIDNLYKIVQGF